MDIPVSLIISLACLIWLTVSTVRSKRQPALPQAPAPAPITARPQTHRLLRTYISRGEPDDPWIDGWRFRCSCGATGVSEGLVQAKNGTGGMMGTEIGAIEKFKIHRDAYIDVNGADEEHPDTIKLQKLEAEFEQWRKACYCKDTNDDLLLLNHRHLDTEPTTTVL